MKVLQISTLVIFGMFAVLNVNASDKCKALLPVNINNMIGEWQMIDNDEKYVMKLNSGNIFIGDAYKKGENVMHTEGTWIVRNNNLHWLHQASNIKSLEGYRDTDRVIELRCDSMLLQNKANEYLLYKRI